jgi:hypothetical protein
VPQQTSIGSRSDAKVKRKVMASSGATVLVELYRMHSEASHCVPDGHSILEVPRHSVGFVSGAKKAILH